MKPHLHAELIKAWADGAEIECLVQPSNKWELRELPIWSVDATYRIKPQPKPDYVEYFWATFTGVLNSNSKAKHNLKIIFDGETAEIKSAEVLK